MGELAGRSRFWPGPAKIAQICIWKPTAWAKGEAALSARDWRGERKARRRGGKGGRSGRVTVSSYQFYV
jgi:hypothetical protein